MKTLFLISIMFFLNGCATFLDEKLSTEQESASFDKVKESIYYDIQIDSVGPDKLKQLKITNEIKEIIADNQKCSVVNSKVRDTANIERPDSVLKNSYKANKICLLITLLMNSGPFKLPDLENDSQKPKGAFLDIKVEEKSPSDWKQKTWAFLSTVTIGIIPYREKTDLNMSLEVFRDGVPIKKYEASGSTVLWMQIALLPYMPFSKNNNDAYKNMMKSILSEMKKDRILENGRK